MNLETITPLILTFNESPNIDRTLKQLFWAQTVVVLDSFSTDETLEILHSYPQVKVFNAPLIPMQGSGIMVCSKSKPNGFFHLMLIILLPIGLLPR